VTKSLVIGAEDLKNTYNRTHYTNSIHLLESLVSLFTFINIIEDYTPTIPTSSTFNKVSRALRI
jgi:hypothetical protein